MVILAAFVMIGNIDGHGRGVDVLKCVPFDQEHSFFCHHEPGTTCWDDQRPLVLPALFYLDGEMRDLDLEEDLQDFLRMELNLSRLNRIHRHLWLAGRPAPARPLHHHLVLGRKIVCTEQTDLHLLWADSRLFVKPCPDYLLSYDFWRRNICHDASLWGVAVGLLLSYTWLVQRKHDLGIAQREGILPVEMTWTEWTRLTSIIRRRVDKGQLEDINIRFWYRELRLGRINWIYRLSPETGSSRNFIHGYEMEYQDYLSFLRHNIAPITAATVYIVLVLTAMQVALNTDRLKDNRAFQDAAYGFSILSILGPLGVLTFLVLIVMGFVFIQHMRLALQVRSLDKERRKESSNI